MGSIKQLDIGQASLRRLVRTIYFHILQCYSSITFVMTEVCCRCFSAPVIVLDSLLLFLLRLCRNHLPNLPKPLSRT